MFADVYVSLMSMLQIANYAHAMILDGKGEWKN